MKTITKKRSLLITGVMLLATSCAIIVASIIFPPTIIQTSKFSQSKQKHRSLQPQTASLKSFEALWSKNLQKDVIDAPPPTPPQKKIPPLPVTLLGTAVDSQNPKFSQAFFTVAGNNVMACQGEKIGTNQLKAEIMEITADSVKLLYFEDTIILKIKE